MTKRKFPLCSPRAPHKERRRSARRVPGGETLADLAEFFGAFSDPTRARLLFALAGSRLCVCELSRLLGVSVSAVSHQLRLLRTLRLIKYTCRGRRVYYELADAHVRRILEVGLSHVTERHNSNVPVGGLDLR